MLKESLPDIEKCGFVVNQEHLDFSEGIPNRVVSPCGYKKYSPGYWSPQGIQGHEIMERLEKSSKIYVISVPGMIENISVVRITIFHGWIKRIIIMWREKNHCRLSGNGLEGTIMGVME